jgi:hypothetical protein
MSSDGEDEYTVRDIVKDFERKQIDLRVMIDSIANRLQSITREPDYSYYGTYLGDEDLASFWLYAALGSGAMSRQEYETAMSELRPIIFPKAE